MNTLNLKKVFLLTLITALSLSALIGIFIFLFGSFGDLESKILFTTLTIGAYSLTALCCGALYDKHKYLVFSMIGITISAIGFLLTLAVIWQRLMLTDITIWKTLIIFVILSGSFAHASLLLLIKSKSIAVNVSLYLTLLFISLVALTLIFLIIMELSSIDQIWYRILGVWAILDVLGTIITPIILKVVSN